MNVAINTIIRGDCIEIMRGMADNSVDFVFTDPPYGHNNNNGDLIANRERALGKSTGCAIAEAPRPILNDGAEANELVRKFFAEAHRVLKPGSCCCCCCGGGPDPQFARWSLWLDEAFREGFKMMVVWDKGPIGMGWHYRRSYETVLVAQKAGAACKWYDETQQIENVIRPGVYGISKLIPSATQHPTEKPVALPAFFLKLHTENNDLVLDPFCGSGSTLIAAKRMGCRWIGIEIDPQYVAMAQARIAAEPMAMF